MPPLRGWSGTFVASRGLTPTARRGRQWATLSTIEHRAVATFADDSPVDENPLAALIAAAGIDLPAERIAAFDRYRQLLWAWNEKLNLTRHTTLEKFVNRDVLDSWQLAALLEQGERVLDVGTGGGVPGVLLAILRPDLAISLCESTAKKARAVEAIVNEQGLATPVYACRAEEVLELNTFETLVVRAVAPLPKILTWLAPHWDSFDRLLVIKGAAWVEERAEARHQGLMSNLELRKAAAYAAPGTGAESVILKIWKEEGGSRLHGAQRGRS